MQKTTLFAREPGNEIAEQKMRSKMTIPSDLCFIFKPSAPMLGTLANPRRRSPKASACETLAGLCHHTEVLLSISTPCGALTKRKLENSTSTSRDRTRLLPTELRDSTTGNSLVNKKTMINHKKNSKPLPSTLESTLRPKFEGSRPTFLGSDPALIATYWTSIVTPSGASCRSLTLTVPGVSRPSLQPEAFRMV